LPRTATASMHSAVSRVSHDPQPPTRKATGS